jgi:uncharacterized protein YaaR (DUF327 family)
MKIETGYRSFRKELKIVDNPLANLTEQKTFSDMMQHQDEKAGSIELNRMLEQIQLQGDRLSKSMTVRELRQYKLLIKKFLEETARKGIQLRDTKGWDRRGRGKRYKLLEEIDEHLLSMADDLLEHEQGRIEILHKIGEIRGMLINLFF